MSHVLGIGKVDKAPTSNLITRLPGRCPAAAFGSPDLRVTESIRRIISNSCIVYLSCSYEISYPKYIAKTCIPHGPTHLPRRSPPFPIIRAAVYSAWAKGFEISVIVFVNLLVDPLPEKER
jgi:hypothetical protein